MQNNVHIQYIDWNVDLQFVDRQLTNISLEAYFKYFDWQKVCIAPILKTIGFWMRLNISGKPQLTANKKRSKMDFFEFWPIFRHLSGSPPKFQRHFCSNSYHYILYLKIIPLVFFWKSYLPMTNKDPNCGFKMRHKY